MSTQSSTAASGAALCGQCIGNYRLVRLLGEGGMGIVYEAVHVSVGGQVAIKIIRPEVVSRPDTVTRFFNEARAANSISHPGIVRVFDCGYAPNGMAYLTMEYLSGESLRERLKNSGRVTVTDSLGIARQIASALHAAHQRQVIHRDLKPDNVMLVPDPDLPSGERVKILDFGIAKVAESLGGDPVRTHSELLMGTPKYMAPEQCRGARYVTDKSDVYSLGIILYQMLAGRLPFIGDSVGELIAMHLTDEPPQLAEVASHLAPQLCKLVHAMLDKKGSMRPSMEEVLRELLVLIPSQSLSQSQRPALAAVASGARLAVLPIEQASPLVPVAQPTAASNQLMTGTDAVHPLRPAADTPYLTGHPPSLPPTQPLRTTALAAPTERWPALPPRQQARRVPDLSESTAQDAVVVANVREQSRQGTPYRRAWVSLVALMALGMTVAVSLWQRHNGQNATGLHTASHSQEAPKQIPSESTRNESVASPPTFLEPDPPTPAAVPNRDDVAPDLVRTKALTALRSKQYEDAQRFAESCTAQKPKDYSCWSILGNTACHNDHFELVQKSISTLDSLGKHELVDAVLAECLHVSVLRYKSQYSSPLNLRNPFNPPSLGDPAAIPLSLKDAAAMPPSLKDAAALAAEGKCVSAMRLAKTYTESYPKDSWSIIGRCACETKADSTANLAMLNLKQHPESQIGLINYCQSRYYRYFNTQLYRK